VKGLTVHTALLAVALVLAFMTWTAGDAPQADTNLIEIWNRDPVRLLSVKLRTAGRSLDVERREAPGGSYLWGIESTRPPAPFRKAQTVSRPSRTFPVVRLNSSVGPSPCATSWRSAASVIGMLLAQDEDMAHSRILTGRIPQRRMKAPPRKGASPAPTPPNSRNRSPSLGGAPRFHFPV